MSGPKRNPDKLNTIGVVVVGICGAVLVYVTIVALQAFYMNDTSEIQTMADYGGQETTAKDHKAAEMGNIRNITQAMRGVVEAAKANPAQLIPGLPPAEKPTIEPEFGRPKPLATPAPAAPAAPGTAPAAGAGSGSGSGSAAAAPETKTENKAEPKAGKAEGKAGKAEGKAGKAEPKAKAVPTGAAHEPAKVPGAGGAPAGSATGAHGH